MNARAINPVIIFVLLWQLILPVQAQTVPENLDLSSQNRSVQASQLHPDQTVQINAGGQQTTVTYGQLVTPAQLVAINQVLNTGQQTIQLGALGNATGGTFVLSSLGGQTLNSLVVPTGVTVIHDFGGNANLNLAGNLVNGGTFYAISSNPAMTSAIINAANILNNQGGLLTTVLPQGGLSGFSNLSSSLNLTLNALNNIVNSGTITSSGNLTALAGGSITNALPAGIIGNLPVMQALNNLNLQSATGNIVNSGIISSQLNNINILSNITGQTNNLLINNLNGSIEALQGSINIRDALFAEKGHLVLWGGDLLSRELNIYSGQGIVNAKVNKLEGAVNIYAGEAHIQAATNELLLNTLALTGDPTFYNTTGSVIISSNLIFSGQPLAIVASQDITTSGFNRQVRTNSGSGDAGDIVMIAGASFTSTGPAQDLPPPPGDTTSTLTITGGSATGGLINVTALSALNASSTGGNGDGGNITLIAYYGSSGASGRVLIPTGVTITAGGNGSGSNGNVTIIAGSAGNNNTVTVGAITTNGGTGGGGDITIANATPTIIGTDVQIVNGAITSGSFGLGATQNRNITTDNLTASGAITITAGNNAVIQGNVTTTNSTITINAGNNVQVQGNVSSNGTGSNNGGTIILNSDSGTSFNIGSTNGGNRIEGDITANAGPSGGAGGSITISNTGGNVRLFNSAVVQADATNGPGGSVNLSAAGLIRLDTANTINLDAAATGGSSFIGGQFTANSATDEIMVSGVGSSTFTISANGVNNGDGGNIGLSSVLGYNIGGGDNLILNANASGSGNGGTVQVTSTGAGDISVGTAATTITIQATGGSGGSVSGHGGTVILSAGANLAVDTAGITAGPLGTNGDGATYTLTAGTNVATGNMQITGDLNLDGQGSGTGGTLDINYSETASAFLAGTIGADSFVNGNISANAPGSGNGGSINIINSQAATVDVIVTGNVSADSTSGNTGIITLTKPGQNISLSGAGLITGLVVADGVDVSINLTNTNQILQIGTITASGTTTITLTSAATQEVVIPTGSSITSDGSTTISNENITVSGTITTDNDSPILLQSTGPLTIQGNGSMTSSGGGATASVTLQAAGANALTIDGNLNLDAGTDGTVIIQSASAGGSIIFATNSSVTVPSSWWLQMISPTITLNDNALITATSSSLQYIDINSGNLAMVINLPSGAGQSATIQASNGTIWIGPYGPGVSLDFNAAAASTLNLNSPMVQTWAIAGTTTIAANATITSNGNITMNADGGSIAVSGILQSTLNGGTISFQGWESNLSMNGIPGTIRFSGGAVGTINLATQGLGNTINFNSSYTLNPGLNGLVVITSTNINIASSTSISATNTSRLTINTNNLTLGNSTTITTNRATGTAITVNALDNSSPLSIIGTTSGLATISTAGGDILQQSNSLIFAQTGAGNTTLNFNPGTGATVYLNTNIGDATVNNGVTVSTNGNLDMQVWGGGSLINNGILTSDKAGGTMLITGNANFTMTGSGTFSVTGAGANTINIIAYGANFNIAGNTTVNAGNSGTVSVGSANQDMTLSNNVALVSTDGSLLNIQASSLTLGSNAVISTTKSSGTGINVYSAINQPLTITAPSGGSASINTDGSSININSDGAMTYAKSAAGNTTLNIGDANSGSVNINSWNTTTINSGVNLTASKDITFNVQSATIDPTGQINTSNGSIALTASTGLLSIGANSIIYANEGNLVIQNIDTQGGSIQFGSGANIDAFTISNPLLGNVTVFIGNSPGAPVVGNAPANVTVNELGGGVVYFGTNGITASGPTNTLTAKGRNIQFSTGSGPDTLISLSGSVTIDADPPLHDPITNTPASLAVGAIQPAANIASAPNSAVLGIDTTEQTINSVVPSSKANNAKFISATQNSNIAVTRLSNAVLRYNSKTHFNLGRNETILLKNGSVLISARKPVEAKAGDLSVRLNTGAVAILKRDGQVVTLSNLCENKGQSITAVISNGNQHTSINLSAGQEIILGLNKADIHKALAKVPLGRRKTRFLTINGKHLLARSEVSPVMSMQKSVLVKSLIKSKSPTDQVLRDRLLKMAACLMLTTQSHGNYSVPN